MERLTIDEIIEHCDRKTRIYEKACGVKYLETEFMGNGIKEYWEHKQVAEYLKKIKEYKDLKEQGLLLRLPYPLGTERIYFIDKSDMEIYELDGRKIEVSLRDISEDVMYTIDCYEFLYEDFGEIVFLTREEAEAKLAEMEGAE